MSCVPLSDERPETDEEEEGCSERGGSPLAFGPAGDELIPHCGMEDDEVENLNVPYSIRGPDDWVSSGPLIEGLPGRYFPTWDEAEKWAQDFFGARFRGRVMDAFNSGCHRWAFLIKGPRGV